MDALKSSGKPVEVSKGEVWEAYGRVKANRGAPGVDEVTLGEFETDLGNNLYRIWNRMSSGSYFPPPVKAVEIAKPHGGGTRMLGVPTVADRIAQTVVARRLEAKVEPIFHPDSYGYRPNRSALDAVAACPRALLEERLDCGLGIRSFFDSVPWQLVVKAVAAHSADPWVLLYVRRWLAAPLRYPTGACCSETEGLRKGQRSRRCWRTCFCTTRSTPGWPGVFRPSSSSVTPTMQLRTAPPRRRRNICWRRSGTGWRRSGCSSTRPRPGSCTARTEDGGSTMSTPASRSLASRSAPAARGPGTVSISPASCPPSASTPSTG